MAYEYGRQPARTVPGSSEGFEAMHEHMRQDGLWDVNHASNDGQPITAEDLNAITDAPEKAFDDTPD